MVGAENLDALVTNKAIDRKTVTFAENQTLTINELPVVANENSLPGDITSLSESWEDIPSRTDLPKITVRDPVTHETWDQGKFTTYLISLRTSHPSFHLRMSAVRRRFSELMWLDSLLRAKSQGSNALPSAPPKRIFADRFNERFLKKRARAMEKYINEIMRLDEVLSDNAFHLFIQTDLTTPEMEEYFDGTLPESVLTKAWENMGHAHGNYMQNKPPPDDAKEIVMNEEDFPCSSCSSPTESNTSSSSTSPNCPELRTKETNKDNIMDEKEENNNVTNTVKEMSSCYELCDNNGLE